MYPIHDGWIFLRFDLVHPFIECFEKRIERTGGSRNRAKTKVILYVSDCEILSSKDAWKIDEIEQLASICKHDTATLSLGGMLGGQQAVLD